MIATSSPEPPPEWPPGLPFADFLWELRARGYPIGIHDYRDVALLLGRWRETDPAELRNAIAALLARSPEDLDFVRRAFDEWVAFEPPPPPPPDQPGPKRPPRVRPLYLASLVVAVLLGIVLVAWPDPAPPSVDVNPPQPTPEIDERIPPPNPPALRRSSYVVPIVASASLALALFVVAMARRTDASRARWFRDYWRRVLGRVPGPYRLEPKINASPPLAEEDIEQMAAIIGRARETEPSGGRLDVDETLRLTLRAGLRPVVAYEPPPRNVPVLVLEDTGMHMRPWKRHVEQLVSSLARQGVRIERAWFDGDLATTVRRPHGRRVPFDVLAASRADHSLLIVSTGDGLAADTLGFLTRAMEGWTYRTWIHPVRNPDYWPKALLRLPIRIWPLTPAGMRGAAIEISRTQELDLAPRDAAVRRHVTADDVECLKRLIAIVPEPALDLAEELRRRFAPDVPQETLLFLGAAGVFYGETIRLPEEEIARLLRTTSPEETLREREVRRFLVEILRASEPAPESAAHLRWELELAVQQLAIDPAAGDAARILEQLAVGPLHDEVRSRVAPLASRAETRPVVTRTMRAAENPIPEELDAAAVRPELRFPRWRLPRAIEMAAAGFAGALLLGGWLGFAGPPEREEIPHVSGAYSMELGGSPSRPALAITANMDAPSNVTVFRAVGGAWAEYGSVGLPEVFPIEAADAGTFFQARGVLPSGNLGLSDPLLVPGYAPWQPTDPIEERVKGVIVGTFGVPAEDVTLDARINEDLRLDRRRVIAAIEEEFGLEIASADAAGLVRVRDLVDLVRARPGSGRLAVGKLPPGVAISDLTVSELGLDAPGPPVRLTGRDVRLAPGQYGVELQNEMYTWRSRVTIEAGRVTTLDVDASPEFGIVRVTGVPRDAAIAIQKEPLSMSVAGGVWTIRGRGGRYTLPVVGGRRRVGFVSFALVPGREIEIRFEPDRVEQKELDVAPAEISFEVGDVDDRLAVSVNGVEVATWEGGGSRRIALRPGRNLVEIRVYNQSSYTGGIEVLGGRRREGWRYAAAVMAGGQTIWKHQDGENDPPPERHGTWFPVARLELLVDERGTVTVARADTNVWRGYAAAK